MGTPPRGLVEELHRRAHAVRRGRGELGRHARQVGGDRRHIDGREGEPEQVLCEHVGQLDAHQIQQLLRRRTDTLGPSLQKSFPRCDSVLQRVPQQPLVVGILKKPVAYRVEVVGDRAHADHARHRGGTDAEDGEQQLALVQRVRRVSDGSAERGDTDQGASDGVGEGGTSHAGEGAPRKGRAQTEPPTALIRRQHGHIRRRHEGQQTDTHAGSVVTIAADHEGGGEGAGREGELRPPLEQAHGRCARGWQRQFGA